MIRYDANFDELFDACRAALRGPLSTFVDAPDPVREFAQSANLPINSLATSLRRWALNRGDVLYVLLGTTGRKLTLTVLIEHATISRVQAATDEIRDVTRTLDISAISVCILGPKHADSPLVDTSGRYEIFRRERWCKDAEAA
jgi:hypothetical protein